MLPKIVLIILNWNQCALTLACLRSLQAVEYPISQLELVVIDNGSTDDTATVVPAQFPHITFQQNYTNLGYAGGNNIGIQYALQTDAKYIGILNNDVEVTPLFLKQLVHFLESNPSVGACSPLIIEMPATNKVWAAGAKLNWQTAEVVRVGAGSPHSQWQTTTPFAVHILPGTVILAQRTLFEQIGLFDESFFLYYEEIDWCIRAQKAGISLFIVPSAPVYHHVSATLGQNSCIIDYYMARNQLRLIQRHWTGWNRLGLLAQKMAHQLLTITAYSMNSHHRKRIGHRNARLLALRDACLGRWGKMGQDVEKICQMHP